MNICPGDALTLQVNASLIFFKNPIEMTSQACPPFGNSYLGWNKEVTQREIFF